MSPETDEARIVWGAWCAGMICEGCGCPEGLCGCELLVGGEHMRLPEAFTTIIDTVEA